MTANLFRRACLAFCLLAAACFAQAQSLSYKDVLARQPQPQPDFKLAYGSTPFQYGELWLPKTPVAGPLPVVVMIHGGCWLSDYPGPELVAFLSAALADRGVAVWSITYRRVAMGANVQGGGYPNTFLDVGQAVDYLRTLAPTYHLDLARVVTSGHSAGGHLALWAAARARLPTDSPLKVAQPLPIKGVVSIAGLPDLEFAAGAAAYSCGDDTVAKLIDSARRGLPAAYRDTSLLPLLPLGVPQTLISGIYDVVAPPVHAWRYQAAALKAGEQVAIVNLDHAGHFELISPWTGAGAAVVAQILHALE